jgi:hypothetical protein
VAQGKGHAQALILIGRVRLPAITTRIDRVEARDSTFFTMSTSATESVSLSNILEPGFSLNPTFLLVVDCVLAALLVVLLSLAYLTSGNLHIIAMTGIELALWASVKW